MAYLALEHIKSYAHEKAEKFSLNLAFRTQSGGYSVSQRVETIVSTRRDAGLNK